MPFKAFKEKTAQKFGSKKTFTATLSNRTETTYKEAEAFSVELKHALKQIRALQTATAGMLSATAKTLSTPLPRVYDKDVRTGQAVATFESLSERERLALTEEEINLRDLEAIKHHTTSRMEMDVLRPMEQWLRLYKTFPMKLQRIEKERLTYDHERRLYNKVEVKKLRRAQGENPSPKIEAEMKHRQISMDAKQKSFEEYEQDVWQELSQLVKDAKSLRTYLVAAMRVQEQAFSSVTVGETEKVDLTDAHKAPVTANGLAAGASTSGLPTPISEDTSRSHVAHGATEGRFGTLISHTPLTSNAPHALASHADPSPSEISASEVETHAPIMRKEPPQAEEAVRSSGAGSVTQPSTPVQTSRAEENHHQERPNLDIPPQLSLEEELPSVPQTPVTQNPEKVEEKKNSFMGRLLGVGA